MITMDVRADIEYQPTYHTGVQGRIWQALEDTEFQAQHDTNDPPKFSYSNPFPPKDMEEGDQRKLMVASVSEELLAHVAADLLEDRDFNIKQMPFRVTDISEFTLDVGEPGSTGTISCGTGLFIRIPHWDLDRYDMEHPKGENADTPVYWRPEHGVHIVRDQLERALEYKWNLYGEQYYPSPAETDHQLFEEYDYIKNFALPINVDPSHEHEFILSKWRFKYRVRDEAHRKHLNLALNLGLGERTGMGFGFINIDKKTLPHEQEEEVFA